MKNFPEILDAYIKELYIWNRRIRLVGESSSARFRDVHLKEVISSRPLLDEAAWKMAVDIGSGNGLLAIPVASWYPDRKILALEPVRKKCSFLRHLAYKFQLENLVVEQERIQDFSTETEYGQILWLIRGMVIPWLELRKALSSFPGSHLILFSGPGTRSWEYLQNNGDWLTPLRELTMKTDKERRIILFRVGQCFT